MTDQYYGSAEWLADVEREEREDEQAAIAAKAEANAKAEREHRAHLKAEAEAGVCRVRAPYSGRVLQTYRVKTPVDRNEVGAMERQASLGGF